MHARMRLEGNGREVTREIGGYGGRERVRKKATKRERNISVTGERENGIGVKNSEVSEEDGRNVDTQRRGEK